MSASSFLSLSNKGSSSVSVQLHPLIQPGEAGMSAVPEILRGQGDVNKEQSLDSQSHTHTHTHTHTDRFKQESVPGLFSETLERRSSRRGMPIVNTAARRQGEEDLLSLPTRPSVLTTN